MTVLTCHLAGKAARLHSSSTIRSNESALPAFQSITFTTATTIAYWSSMIPITVQPSISNQKSLSHSLSSHSATAASNSSPQRAHSSSSCQSPGNQQIILIIHTIHESIYFHSLSLSLSHSKIKSYLLTRLGNILINYLEIGLNHS